MNDPVGPSYRELYERAPCGLMSVGGDGRIIAVNDTMLEWIGRSRSDVLGTAFLALLPAPDQLFAETRFAPLLQLRGEVREVSLTLISAGGALPVLINARLATDETGAPERRIAIFLATERQSYERQLLTARRQAEASEARVRTLQAASSSFGESHTESQLADVLVEAARDAMGASACAVSLADAEGNVTHLAGVHPLTALANDPQSRPDVLAMRHAGVVIIESIDDARASYPRLVDGLLAARVEAFSVVPIGPAGATIGALLCFFSRARVLTAEDVDLQVSLARQAAQALTRIRLQNELMALALHDPLTGLANRRLLREHLVQAMAATARHARPLAMLALDLDRFKTVNDLRGHQEGDAVLKWVAGAVSRSVRTDDIVGRFGGDEFLVICQEADERIAFEVAERVRLAIAEYPSGLPDGTPLSVSVGAAVCDAEGASSRPEEFFAVADSALYQSKRQGKDRVTVKRFVPSATT